MRCSSSCISLIFLVLLWKNLWNVCQFPSIRACCMKFSLHSWGSILV